MRKGMQCGHVESEKVLCHPVDSKNFFTCHRLHANVAKVPPGPCCKISD